MDADITTTGTRVVYENRWMRVREDAIRRRDGSAGIYGVVDKPDFVVIAPVEAGVVHLVQQFRYPAGPLVGAAAGHIGWPAGCRPYRGSPGRAGKGSLDPRIHHAACANKEIPTMVAA